MVTEGEGVPIGNGDWVRSNSNSYFFVFNSTRFDGGTRTSTRQFTMNQKEITKQYNSIKVIAVVKNS